MTSNYEQLRLFPETTEERHTREIKELKAHCDKLRKSLHAKNSNLAKAYEELKNEFEQLKIAICKSEKTTLKQDVFF